MPCVSSDCLTASLISSAPVGCQSYTGHTEKSREKSLLSAKYWINSILNFVELFYSAKTNLVNF